MIRFVTADCTTLIRVESTTLGLQHELVHGKHAILLAVLDTPRESRASLEVIDLLLVLMFGKLHLQLFLCKVIDSSPCRTVYVDVWQERAYRLIIH